MRVLVIGGTGMLGHKLYQSLNEPIDTWVTVRGNPRELAKYGFYCPDRVIGGIDATDSDQVRQTLEKVRPHVVINCVGLIKQHPLAKKPEACITVNALLPHRLAELSADFDARLIHISTDCVFAGTKGGYVESDLTDAEDLYGRTKALGETTAPNSLTLRTSIIGRELAGDYGLIEWYLANANQPVKGFTHARFSGFTTIELARVVRKVLLEHSELTGLYQVSSDPIDKCSLLHIARQAYGLNHEIERSDELRIDRTLNSTRFRTATGYEPPSWPAMIREMSLDRTPYDSWRENE